MSNKALFLTSGLVCLAIIALPLAAKAEKPAKLQAATAVTNDIVPPVTETELNSETVTTTEYNDAVETPPLRLTPDKPELVRLDKDAVNVVVGSDAHLRVVPDTNKNLILIPKKPGATYFKALDSTGSVIMQRHVIIATPQQNYIRVRRACAMGAEGCKEFTVYYCPDMCHEVNVMQDTKQASAAAPDTTPSVSAPAENQESDGSEPPPGEGEDNLQ